MDRQISISPKSLWSVFGLVLLLALTSLLFARASNELILVFSAIVIGEGIRPLIKALRTIGVPHALATLAVIVAIVAVIAGLLYLVISPLTIQIASLIDHIPEISANVQRLVVRYQDMLANNPQARNLLAELPARISAFLSSQASLLISFPILIAQSVTNVFLLLLLVFFWLSASEELATFTLSFYTPQRVADGRALLDDLSLKTGGYLRGVVINMTVIGLVSGLGDYFLGVPYPLLLGVVAGLTEAIPIIGPVLGGAVAVVVALVTVDWHKAVQVAIFYVVVQQLESNTLVPLVMNRAVAIDPLTITVALIIGSAVAGIPGAILSLPVAAIVQVIVRRVVAPAARRARDRRAAAAN